MPYFIESQQQTAEHIPLFSSVFPIMSVTRWTWSIVERFFSEDKHALALEVFLRRWV
jgi:hypothetical protein